MTRTITFQHEFENIRQIVTYSRRVALQILGGDEEARDAHQLQLPQTDHAQLQEAVHHGRRQVQSFLFQIQMNLRERE